MKKLFNVLTISMVIFNLIIGLLAPFYYGAGTINAAILLAATNLIVNKKYWKGSIFIVVALIFLILSSIGARNYDPMFCGIFVYIFWLLVYIPFRLSKKYKRAE